MQQGFPFENLSLTPQWKLVIYGLRPVNFIFGFTYDSNIYHFIFYLICRTIIRRKVSRKLIPDYTLALCGASFCLGNQRLFFFSGAHCNIYHRRFCLLLHKAINHFLWMEMCCISNSLRDEADQMAVCDEQNFQGHNNSTPISNNWSRNVLGKHHRVLQLPRLKDTIEPLI